MWEEEHKYGELNTFPFAITPYRSDHILKTDFWLKTHDQKEASSRRRIKIFNQEMFTAGRLYTSLYDTHFQHTGYYAFDVVIFLSWNFFGSPLMKQMASWLFIYILINLLIIQRVIKFGNQITKNIIQKFNQLTLGIRQISGGNLDYRIKMEGEDEFVELAERFNRMGKELQKNISELRDKDRLEHELRIARDVQLGLLPKTLPDIEGYQITAYINTATEVGGDFYDMIPLPTGKFLLVIGDVSGKGTSAAFYMAQCISLIRFASQFTDNPREILLRLNRYFSDPMIDKQIFVTTVLGVLDTKKHQITLLRAGHNHPILISGKGSKDVREIQIPGLGIGLEREGTLFEKTVKSKLLRLGKGDALFLYTDGLVEASAYADEQITDPQNVSFFGEDRLIEIINKARKQNSADLIQDINDEVKSFYGQSPLIDDLTMLLIQRERE
jgi:sigma-B regulation protein RsbU (phosphoserine phosphatase)